MRYKGRQMREFAECGCPSQTGTWPLKDTLRLTGKHSQRFGLSHDNRQSRARIAEVITTPATTRATVVPTRASPTHTEDDVCEAAVDVADDVPGTVVVDVGALLVELGQLEQSVAAGVVARLLLMKTTSTAVYL
jgi:hypothetical protein